jgi:tetratricopeptide (TPR) repeat protein
VTRRRPGVSSPTFGQKLLLIAFGLALVVVSTAIVEVGLWLTRLGESDLYEDPFVGFAPGHDLFVKKTLASGEEVFRTSPEKLAYFNEQEFPVEKADDVFRIFALGGSTTAGRPYDARVSFPRWLELYLEAADPSHRHEVINAGGISYASYRVALLMKELLRYEPDLFVVYTGHNEFLEERTYSQIIHQHPLLKRARLRLNGLRSYALLRRAVRALGSEQRDVPTTLDADVKTRLETWRGLDLYHRDPELKDSILAHFEYNLEQMAAIARSGDVALVFVEPISNLKDFSPFKSEHRSDLSPAEEESFAGYLAAGRSHLAQGNAEAALASLRQAADVDPEYAEAHFRLGQSLMALGRHDDAREAFARAKELDIAPLRALESQSQILTEVSRRGGFPLIALPAIIEADCTGRFGHRIPGNEYFLDHVHPNLSVHALIAEEIVDLLAEQGIISPGSTWSEETRKQIAARVTGGMDERYYAQRDLNLAKVLGWAGKIEEAEAPLSRSVALLDENPEAHLNLGIVYQRTGRLEEARAELEKAVALAPDSPEAYFNLGVVHGHSGELLEGVEALQDALRLRPDYAEAHFNLGVLYRRLGRWGESIAALERALELQPDGVEIYRHLALGYRGQERIEEALTVLRRGLDIDPEDAEARTELGITLARAGRLREAAKELERAAARAPRNAEAHYNLGVVKSQLGRETESVDAYRRALESDPSHVRALNNLGILLAKGGSPIEARAYLLRAIELDGSYADAHFNLAVVQDSSGEPLAAIRSLERAVEIEPDNGRYHLALGMMLAAQQLTERAVLHLRRAQEAGVNIPDEALAALGTG